MKIQTYPTISSWWCFRWDNTNLEVHEEFAGLYQTADTSAKTILQALKDCLIRMKLQWNHCRGKCYDGAVNLAGLRNGVAAQILRLQLESSTVHPLLWPFSELSNVWYHQTVQTYQRCNGRNLWNQQVTKVSPKHNAIFDKLMEKLSPDSPGFRVLCPKCWTVRVKSLQSVQMNYSVLQELWSIVRARCQSPCNWCAGSNGILWLFQCCWISFQPWWQPVSCSTK